MRLTERQIFAICWAALLGNDFLFQAVSGQPVLIFIDYAVKLVLLVLLLGTPAPWEVFRSQRPSLASFLTLLAVAGVYLGLDHLSGSVPVLWKLFKWPVLDGPLFVLDQSFGLLLTAISEELIFRVLAFRVIGGTVARRVLLSALAFSAIHWGSGPGDLLGSFGFGLLAGWHYARFADVRLLIAAHFLIDLYLFW